MLCCGFELLGSTTSKHDVALACPSADALKVLGETRFSSGLKLALEPKLVPAAGTLAHPWANV